MQVKQNNPYRQNKHRLLNILQDKITINKDDIIKTKQEREAINKKLVNLKQEIKTLNQDILKLENNYYDPRLLILDTYLKVTALSDLIISYLPETYCQRHNWCHYEDKCFGCVYDGRKLNEAGRYRFKDNIQFTIINADSDYRFYRVYINPINTIDKQVIQQWSYANTDKEPIFEITYASLLKVLGPRWHNNEEYKTQFASGLYIKYSNWHLSSCSDRCISPNCRDFKFELWFDVHDTSNDYTVDVDGDVDVEADDEE